MNNRQLFSLIAISVGFGLMIPALADYCIAAALGFSTAMIISQSLIILYGIDEIINNKTKDG